MNVPTDPAELFDLKKRLARLIVLGPWEKTSGGWKRPEAASPASRIQVWESTAGSSDMEPGWYYRFGFGVLCIPGVSGTTAFATAEACMAAVDKILSEEDSIIFDKGTPT